ncbi:response regulator [Algibacter sp. L3A6]|jgi:response regulator RpfG family c-di-GMP phosphodiesterase|uniref:response regulator n=1 Tax=Algibacter sp. L3A6 TaxID=2686366 RepID=UPI00131CBE8D|nr:response regulator [Algibacter sp. L3A6]
MEKNVILCVDDEKIILDSIKAQLKENYGNLFLYETAESATEALDIIEDLELDLSTNLIIISDWLMPVIKGDEFLIKVHHMYPNALKIMLTGHADYKSIKKTEDEADLYKCIKKPWVRSELFSCIDSGLQLT